MMRTSLKKPPPAGERKDQPFCGQARVEKFRFISVAKTFDGNPHLE